jgi:hypothetical protein
MQKVQLAGSASDAENNLVSYEIFVDGFSQGRSSFPSALTSSVHLLAGSHVIKMLVRDSKGLSASDEMIVEVKPALVNSINVSAGYAQTLYDLNLDRSEPVRMSATVNAKTQITSYQWLKGTSILASGTNESVLTMKLNLPLGENNLNLVETDGSGIAVSDNVTIVVSARETAFMGTYASNFAVSSYLTESYGAPQDAASDDVGAFRTLCNASHALWIDPVASPNVNGISTLNMFFGNSSVSYMSDYYRLRSTGSGSCHGGPLDRSAYWMPALLDANGQVVVPNYMNVMYKEAPGKCKFPRGFRMKFGYNKTITDPNLQQGFEWKCGNGKASSATLADLSCPAGSDIIASISAPNCWRGNSPSYLTSTNNSHVAYKILNQSTGKFVCPSTHPIELPSLSYLVYFSNPGDFNGWKLTSDSVTNADGSVTNLPAGSTLQGGFYPAWDDGIMELFTNNCLNGSKSCASGDLGNGLMLKMNSSFSWTANPRLISPPAKPATGAGGGGGSVCTSTSGGRTICSMP